MGYSEDLIKIPWALQSKIGTSRVYPEKLKQNIAGDLKDAVAIKYWNGTSLVDTSPLAVAYAHDDPRNTVRIDGYRTYTTKYHDISGNGHDLTISTDTAQPLKDPACDIYDGVASYGEITIPEYLPNVQSNDDCVSVIADETTGTTTIKLGKTATGTYQPINFKHLTAFRKTLSTARQSSLEAWEDIYVYTVFPSNALSPSTDLYLGSTF